MNLRISAAVAATLACGTPAFALDLTTTVNIQNGAMPGIVMNVAGSSSARDAFANMLLNGVCQVGTFDLYRASPTSGADFRAYSCRILDDSVFGGAANRAAVIFYRSEGGSAWGLVPMSRRSGSGYTPANDIAIMRLNVDASCFGTVTAPEGYTIHNCPLPANDYQVNSDTSSSSDANLALDTVDLGVADQEPKMYTGVHFPAYSSRLSVIPTGDRVSFMNQLNLLMQPGFGQTFGVIVNNTTGPLAGTLNATRRGLGKNVVAYIFNGTYTNWNQVLTIDGTAASPGSVPIKVCRRKAGSGAQVAAHQYFLRTPGCPASYPLGAFVTDGPDNDDLVLANDTDGVIERASTGDLATCVASLPGAIGFIVGDTAPAGTVFVDVGTGIPARIPAAANTFDFWFEQTFTINPRIAAGPLLDLAVGLISNARSSFLGPNVPSVVALPNEQNDPFAQGQFQVNRTPISIGTRSGDSCRLILPILP